MVANPRLGGDARSECKEFLLRTCAKRACRVLISRAFSQVPEPTVAVRKVRHCHGPLAKDLGPAPIRGCARCASAFML
jgi:hypothetical protein